VNFTCEKYEDEPPTNVAGKVNLPEIINTIVKINSRNDLIIKLLKQSLLEKRNIILLSERRSHCEYLLETLTKEIPDVNAGLYMGGMKQHVLKENENCDVLFATYSLAHEGLDIPKLDTLILATSKSDVVQSCGRILRETGTKKNNPLIYDIVDTWGPLVGQARKRKTFYNKSGFNLNTSNEEETLTKFNNCVIVDE
jgi:superfamily II DNA or RNA helicase